jgi:hypothetical protein
VLSATACLACSALAASLVVAAPAHSSARPAAVAVSAARTTPSTRSFTVRVNARAARVVVCDVEPFWCAPASRAGRRTWTAVLPTGPLPSSGPSDATGLRGPAPPGPVAGANPTFRIEVLATGRAGVVKRRSFRGTYRAALPG